MVLAINFAPRESSRHGRKTASLVSLACPAALVALPCAASAQDAATRTDSALFLLYLAFALVLGALFPGAVRAIRRGREAGDARQGKAAIGEARPASEGGTDRFASGETNRRENDDNFRRFVEGVTDYAIYMLDPNGYVTTWNAGAERIKGYTASEILGRHFSCFYTPEDQAAGIPAKVLATAEREGRYESEGTIRVRKDGSTFHASVVMDRLSDSSGRPLGYAKITRDITERVEQNAALEEARAALAQSQKMEAIGHLTGGIAHDFNNMLAVIIGALNMMQRRIGRGDYNVEPLVNAAVEGAMRGAQLTQRLLAFARKQLLEPRPLDANKLLGGMSDLIRRALGETIQTEIISEGGLWRIHADAHQLETAIINLVVNARDAMPEGGKLTVETANASITEAYGRPQGIAPGQYVAISVTDTGVGMAQDVIDKAFDPFFTTKKTGTGLGLSMVYGFVKQSGGHVKIHSKQGVGTTVRIYLPRYFGPKEDVAEAQPSQPPTAKEGETILVVEDEPAVRKLTIQGLVDLGYRVVEAENAEHALELLQRHQDVDLLFTDVVMPQMNGRQLVQEALKLQPQLKVLYTTGYARNAVAHNGVLDPDVKLLHKPFTLDALARAVRRGIETA